MFINLHARYSLTIIAVVIAVAATLTFFLMREFRLLSDELSQLNAALIEEQLLDRAETQSEIFAGQLARNLDTALYYMDIERIAELLEVSLENQEVEQIVVVNSEHKVVHDGTEGVDGFGNKLELSQDERQRLESGETLKKSVDNKLTIFSPILLGKQYIGAVVVRYSLEGIRHHIARLQEVVAQREQEKSRQMILSVSLVTIVLIALGAMVSTFVARKLKEPIDQLVKFAHQIGNGVLDKKVKIDRRDELGDLAASLNHMASRLDNRTRAIEFLAYHDALTKLPNRDFLKSSLTAAISRSQRNETSLALLFIDIDNFKTVNDVYGHEAGDFILIVISQRIQQSLRECDLVVSSQDAGHGEPMLGRLAGDEFVVMLEGCERLDAASVSQRILDSVSSAYQWKNTSITLGISIGIAVYPDNGEDTDTLLRNADAAMYHVKSLGKNNFHFFSPELDQIAHLQLELVDQLDRAIRENQLELWYQVQYDTLNRKVIGAEALVRWRHPEKGMLLPDVFVPLAEKSIYSYPLGEWVLQEAISQLKKWSDLAPDFHLSVNISPLQLQRQGWLKGRLETMAVDKALANRINLEVTETFFLKAEGAAKEELREIKALGFNVWLDDFGTGYSSLNHLKHFPVDGVKIDRSFIAELDTQWESKALTKAIIRVAQAFDISVIAEGVETDEQEKRLKKMGCYLMQGYKYSQPLPAGEFENLLRVEEVEID